MSAAAVTHFYNTFVYEELQIYQPSWPGPPGNGATMFPTPSPSSSGSYTPGQSEEDEMYSDDRPYLKIVEQPASKFRFRYRSEMQGAHGSLLGNMAISKKKTFPTVELINYHEQAIIRCSLYTAGDPPKPHIHQLISKGKQNSEDVLDHEVVVSESNGFQAEFKGLGIVHMSKKDLTKELVRKKEKLLREKIQNHPNLNKLTDSELSEVVKNKMPELVNEAKKEAETMDPNKVKLCFEAFASCESKKLLRLCDPVFSDTIQNMKSAETSDLRISRMDRCGGPASGYSELWLLVEKVCKNNIRVRFFELDENDQEVWSADGEFNESDVHHQYAIVLKTPPYRDTDIEYPVKVKIELVRKKDNARSEPLTFTYKPVRRYGVGKRTCATSSSSEFWSSSESPKRPKHTESSSADDPMLSGSDSSGTRSFNSLPINSEELVNILASYDGDQSNVTQFAELLLNSPDSDVQSLLQFKEPGDVPGDVPKDPNFSNVQITFSPSMTPPTASVFDVAGLSGQLFDGVETDSHQKEKPLEKRGLSTSRYEKKDLAKKSYLRLLKLLQSRHPNRLQDMKSIIRAEDDEYGPLHAAVMHGQVKELGDLLSLIIKSNLLKLINCIDKRHKTPLMVAVEEDQVDCLKVLCAARADLNFKDEKDNTALHLAAKFKHSKCMEALLSSKPVDDSCGKLDLNIQNEKGETALHIAVRAKHPPCVKMLLAAGADLNVPTGTAGSTPLHLAVEYDCNEIVAMLLSEETINVHQTNFNGKTAADLVKPSNKCMLMWFEKDAPASDLEGEEEDDEEHDKEEEVGGEREDEEETKFVLENLKIVSDEEDSDDDETNDGDGDLSTDDFTLIDEEKKNKIANDLDKNDKWKRVCEKLDCSFLVEAFTNVLSPTICLITYLEFKKEVSLSEFRDVIKELDVPDALDAVDNVLIMKQDGRKF